MTRRLTIALSVAAATLLVFSCQPPGSSSSGPSTQEQLFPASSTLHNPSALFVGQGTVNRSVGGTTMSLFEVLTDGTIQPVSFYDTGGNKVGISVLDVYPISANYVGIGFYLNQVVREAVLELSTGNVYDFSSYQLRDAFFRAPYLYVKDTDNRTLYKVDLANLVAIPINNPQYDPVSDSDFFYVTPDDLVFIDDSSKPNGTLNGGKIFFPDNRPPVSTISYSFGTFPAQTGWRSTFLTPNDSIWDVSYGSPDPSANSYEQMTIDSSGVAYGTPINYGNSNAGSILDVTWVNPSIYDTQRYILYANGYFDVQIVNNIPSISYTAKPFPSAIERYESATGGSPGYLRGTKLFIQVGSTIKYMDIVSDSDFTDFVTPSGLIRWAVLSADTIIYSAYITGTNVGTYEVSIGGTPTLISSSDMQVKDVVPFSLP